MIYSATPQPGSAAMTEHSCVRLKRSLALNPAGALAKGTLGAVVSCADGLVHAVEFIVKGESFVVSFEHQQDALEPAEWPAERPTVENTAAPASSGSDEELDVCPEFLHYYAFSFGHVSFDGGAKAEMDCVYLGLREKRVSASCILNAKSKSTLPASCTLLAVNYLGCMSEDEFNDI